MDQNSTETARLAWLDVVEECGSDPVSEEQSILSIGRDLLPPCAVVVLDGGEPTADYYEWLQSQTEEAQAEHDRDYAAGVPS